MGNFCITCCSNVSRPNYRWLRTCQSVLIRHCWWMVAPPQALPIPCMSSQTNLQCLHNWTPQLLESRPRGKKVSPSHFHHLTIPENHPTCLYLPNIFLSIRTRKPLRVVYVLPSLQSQVGKIALIVLWATGVSNKHPQPLQRTMKGWAISLPTETARHLWGCKQHFPSRHWPKSPLINCLWHF